jgi:fucose permease
MRWPDHRSLCDCYHMLATLLIIPLGAIITVRAALFGLQAWTLLLLGLAFVALGIVRLRATASPRAGTHGPANARKRP